MADEVSRENVKKAASLDIPETHLVVARVCESFAVGGKRDRANLPIVTAVAKCVKQFAGRHAPEPDAVRRRPFAPGSREGFAVRGENESGNSEVAKCMNEGERLRGGGMSRRRECENKQQSQKTARHS